MKTTYITGFALFFSLFLMAQHTITVDAIELSFETTVIFKKYDTGSDNVLGYHNKIKNSDDENYAIDIELFKIDTQDYSNDIKEATTLIAKQLGFTDVEDGGKLPFIENGYYVLAYDRFADEITPVYIIFIKNEAINEAYEATLYCYNKNKKDGLKMARSFKFLD
ncbi:MAG: hypothetical protein COA67_03960 [Lutibacter sp.]|nr:MAG: hypothetical protein COA67_03960 [Lutibacter sp.]